MFHRYRVIGPIEFTHCHKMRRVPHPNTSAFQVAYCRSESTIDARRQSCRVCIAASRDRSIGEETIDDLALIVLYDSSASRLTSSRRSSISQRADSDFRISRVSITKTSRARRPNPESCPPFRSTLSR